MLYAVVALLIYIDYTIDRNEKIMARLSIDPPKLFNFSNPNNWPRWKKRFYQFHEASSILAENQTRKSVHCSIVWTKMQTMF